MEPAGLHWGWGGVGWNAVGRVYFELVYIGFIGKLQFDLIDISEQNESQLLLLLPLLQLLLFGIMAYLVVFLYKRTYEFLHFRNYCRYKYAINAIIIIKKKW